jgi:hypothetical protein
VAKEPKTFIILKIVNLIFLGFTIHLT